MGGNISSTGRNPARKNAQSTCEAKVPISLK